jgi:hypothetical protein
VLDVSVEGIVSEILEELPVVVALEEIFGPALAHVALHGLEVPFPAVVEDAGLVVGETVEELAQL